MLERESKRGRKIKKRRKKIEIRDGNSKLE